MSKATRMSFPLVGNLSLNNLNLSKGIKKDSGQARMTGNVP